jgi:hypothetical protein
MSPICRGEQGAQFSPWDATIASDKVAFYSEGIAAHEHGARRATNPHPRWSQAWVAWLAGWDESFENSRDAIRSQEIAVTERPDT